MLTANVNFLSFALLSSSSTSSIVTQHFNISNWTRTMTVFPPLNVHTQNECELFSKIFFHFSLCKCFGKAYEWSANSVLSTGKRRKSVEENATKFLVNKLGLNWMDEHIFGETLHFFEKEAEVLKCNLVCEVDIFNVVKFIHRKERNFEQRPTWS